MADEVGTLGEFALIDAVTRVLGAPPPPAGPGDDAAIVPAPDGALVATTDLLADGVHFRTDWAGGYDIGRRAAAANLADVAAMGGRGTALLVGLALPPDLGPAWAIDLARGLRAEAALVGAVVVGGDMIASRDRATVAVTALGTLDGRPAVTRAGARPGDVLVAVGRLGHAAAGLALYRAGQPERFPEIAAAYRRPEVPYPAGPALARAGAHALCDVSDGLLADAGHLAAASGVRIEVDAAAVRDPALDPVAAVVGVRDAWELTGGDDHALLAAVRPGADLHDAALRGARIVGRVLAGEGVTVRGAPLPDRAGYEHFGPP